MKYVRWVILSLLVLAGAWIVIWGPRSSEARPEGYTVVRYWEKWTGDEAEKMKIIVRDFNATEGKKQKIYVEYLSMTQVDQKTLISTAAGVPPEVAGLWQDQIPQWAALDALEPLEDLAKNNNQGVVIDENYYKPVYWKACNYRGHLVGLISTPASIMLHYSKDAFRERYKELHAAGRDAELKATGFTGERAPRTLKEFNEWSQLLTKWEWNADLFKDTAKKLQAAGLDAKMKQVGFDGTKVPASVGQFKEWGKLFVEAKIYANDDEFFTAKYKTRLDSAGFIPSEPGWWRTRTPIWWGAQLYNEKTDKFQFTSKESIDAFTWWQSFSKPDNLGFNAINDFSSGFGNFASAQNPFLAGKVAMTFQGPWMVTFIQLNKPEWNNPAVKDMDPKSAEFKKSMDEYYKLPAEKRREMAGWGVAPFPSVFSDEIVEQNKDKGDTVIDSELRKHGVAFCDFDVLVIPKGAAHKKEAFEFIAYVNRREVMNKLCASHGKPTPLAAMPSEAELQMHPNPYIESFDSIARSEHSQALSRVPIWREAEEALGSAVDRITRYNPEKPKLSDPKTVLNEALERVEPKLLYYRELERKRGIFTDANGMPWATAPTAPAVETAPATGTR